MQLIVRRRRASLQRGMTLIELMIGITIAAILLFLAAPLYRDFIANTNVRSAAENTVNGLRRANAEAIKRNAPVQFSLIAGGWQIDELNSEDGAVVETIETYKFSEGASKATIDSLDSGVATTFTGLGRIRTTNFKDVKPITDIQFSTTMSAEPRILHVVVGNQNSASGVRMCDTKFASNDPSGCPDGIANR